MPSPEVIGQLTDLGGLGLFVFVVALAAVAMYRRWLVIGWVVTEKDRRIERLERALDRAATRERWYLSHGAVPFPGGYDSEGSRG